MSRTIIRGGRVLDPANDVDADLDLLVDQGIISGLFPPGHPVVRPSASDTVIDARGLWVLPGFVDPHVHLRQPGMSEAEDIASGTRAAAAGGYTTIVCMPNTSPVLDTPAVVETLHSNLKTDAHVRVLIAAALSFGLKGQRSTDLPALLDAGAYCWSDDGVGTQSPRVMAEALEVSEKLKRPLLIHPEERSLNGGGVMRAGPVAKRLGLAGIPSAAERVRVQRDIRLQRRHGGRIHFQHLSTKGAVEAVRRAKQYTDGVTCEATPHHLLLTDLDLERSGDSGGPSSNFKMNPPLCRPEQRRALRQALSDGIIDAIGTDHAPHTMTAKSTGFERAPFGVTGLETSFALILKLVKLGVLDLKRAIQLLTAGPARVLGLDAGTLAEGRRADICIVDPRLEWKVEKASSESKSFNTPFSGWSLEGKPVLVIWGGAVIWNLVPGLQVTTSEGTEDLDERKTT